MITINSISKTIENKKIIDSFSLSIKSSEIAVLIGSSGVGKSTILRILNNLETFESGTILFDNTNSNTIKKQTVGMVFQNFNLFKHLTVKENITLSLLHINQKSENEANVLAEQLLKQYGLLDKANNYPHHLSGGQKQRLAIARTIATGPTLICFDEPTSALDPFLTNEVAKNIVDLANLNYHILLTTHDMSLLEKLPCSIHLMHNGKIIESAESSLFFKDKKAYPKIDTFIKGQ